MPLNPGDFFKDSEFQETRVTDIKKIVDYFNRHPKLTGMLATRLQELSPTELGELLFGRGGLKNELGWLTEPKARALDISENLNPRWREINDNYLHVNKLSGRPISYRVTWQKKTFAVRFWLDNEYPETAVIVDYLIHT